MASHLLLLLLLLTRPLPATVPIKSRHVLFTGGSSGIGLALAVSAGAAGARVSLLPRNPDAARTVRLTTGVDAAFLTADVRDAHAIAHSIASAGPVDIPICNHGVFVPEELKTQDMEEIKLMIDINLMGTIHVIKASLPAMKQRVKKTGVPASIEIMSSQAASAHGASMHICSARREIMSAWSLAAASWKARRHHQGGVRSAYCLHLSHGGLLQGMVAFYVLDGILERTDIYIYHGEGAVGTHLCREAPHLNSSSASSLPLPTAGCSVACQSNEVGDGAAHVPGDWGCHCDDKDAVRR